MVSVKDPAFTLQQLLDQLKTQTILSEHSITASQRDAVQQLADAKTVLSIPIRGFELDSRLVEAQEVFVLLKSQSQGVLKSRDYAIQAMKQAAFILSEIEPAALDIPSETTDRCPIVFVANIRDILGSLIQQVFRLQSPKISDSIQAKSRQDDLPIVAAVTGTNGKTTISQLLAQICQLAGITSAIMGTAGNGKLGQLTQASHTTADVLAAQRFLANMAAESVSVLALEASSHGLDQQRLQGMPIKVAIYSNLSRDHLDYHDDMADYSAAKAKLFDRSQFAALTHAVINIDDEFASTMIKAAKASGIQIWTYSLNPNAKASFVARQIKPSLEGTSIEIVQKVQEQCEQSIWVDSPLLGRFNVANLLAAVAGAVALGVRFSDMPALIPTLQGASGRMQRIKTTEGCFIVDYAHTPDALTQVMTSLKAHCDGQLWAVFGCGGDRDAGKRPLMAQAGLAVADRVILTSDNPRSEDPAAILADMQEGMSPAQMKRTHIDPDRRQAIRYAAEQADSHDIVVIAGKGHETYQEINGERYDFDDTVVLEAALHQAGKLAAK